MFDYAICIHKNTGLWNTSKVDNIKAMFQEATSFNQDLSSRGLSNIGSKLTEFTVYLTLEELNVAIWGTFT